MKIKKIKDIDNIHIKLSHLELMVLKKALQNSELTLFDVDKFNEIVFDKDEIKRSSDIRDINKEMQKEISKKIKDIYPY